MYLLAEMTREAILNHVIGKDPDNLSEIATRLDITTDSKLVEMLTENEKLREETVRIIEENREEIVLIARNYLQMRIVENITDVEKEKALLEKLDKFSNGAILKIALKEDDVGRYTAGALTATDKFRRLETHRGWRILGTFVVSSAIASAIWAPLKVLLTGTPGAALDAGLIAMLLYRKFTDACSKQAGHGMGAETRARYWQCYVNQTEKVIAALAKNKAGCRIAFEDRPEKIGRCEVKHDKLLLKYRDKLEKYKEKVLRKSGQPAKTAEPAKEVPF